MDEHKKLNLRLIIATLLAIVGAGLLIAGFIVPPLGAIDSSVLIAFGETSTFVGAILGVDYNYRWKIFKKKEEDKLKSCENMK